MPAPDPESFRGKLYLIVLDKVVIGALIAIAFVVYDRWKTQELRSYEQETQFAFKRAEYVKELVPIVLDTKQDVLYRAHSLGALVETNSIDANSAVNLAEKLLLSNVLGRGEYVSKWTNPVNKEVHTYIYSSHTASGYMLSIMLKTMPAGLPALLSEYESTRIRTDPSNEARPNGQGLLNDASSFWRELFWETIRQHTDSELKVLDSDEFLVKNIITLDAILPEFPRRSDSEGLAKRRVKGLRILGSIRLLTESRDADAYAIAQLQSVIDPATQRSDALKLAVLVTRRLANGSIACTSLSGRFLAIVLRREDFAFHRKDLGDEPSPMEDRFHAATDYLVGCAENPKVADELEPTMLPVLRSFYDRLKGTSSGLTGSELGYPEGEMFRLNYPIEWALIQFLVKAESVPNRNPGSETQRFLSDIFSLPEDKLVEGGVQHFAEEWKNARTNNPTAGRPSDSKTRD